MLPEEKNSTPRQQDAFDAFLKRKLQEAPSAMPESMLQSILEKNRKRKAAMFFWLNTVVLLYIACWFLAGIPLFDKNVGATENATQQTAATNANAMPQVAAAETTAVDTLVSPTTRNNGAEVAPNTGEAVYANRSTQDHPRIAQQGKPSNRNARSGRRTAEERIANAPAETKGPAGNASAETVDVDAETAGATNTSGTDATAAGDIQEPGFDEPVLADIADADADETEQDPAPSSDSKGKTPKGKKPAKGGVDNKNPKHWKVDAWMGLGMVRDQVDFQVAEFDGRYYHKDYASVLAQTAPKLTGTQLGVGLRGFITDRVTLDGGLQFAQMQSIVNFEYTIKEIPIVDTNELILGYFQLPDTSQKAFSYTGTSNFVRIGVPLQLGYTYPFGNTWQLTGSVGLMPQITLHQTMTGFERVDLSKFGSLQLENYIRMPATFSLGLYRNEDQFTYGLMGRISPFYGREIQVGDGMRYGSLRLRGYDVGFRIMYQFGGAAKK
ncbi:MAG: hypothetical protein ACOVQJ_10315 [Bacteroidia bacterium]